MNYLVNAFEKDWEQRLKEVQDTPLHTAVPRLMEVVFKHTCAALGELESIDKPKAPDMQTIWKGGSLP